MIAKSVSRLGRNTKNSMDIADQLEKNRIRLILPEDSYDTLTSTSRLNFNLKAVISEEESKTMSQRIKLGLKERAKQGKYNTSKPPYGYTINHSTGCLEIDETYASIVREIYSLYLNENWGMSKIGNYLMSRNIAPPRAAAGMVNSGNRWHQQTIKIILTNPSYTGKLVSHRSQCTEFLVSSETYKIRELVPEENYVVVENTHLPIISQEDFDAVQALMRKKSVSKSNGSENLFANIARCSDCGCGMHFKSDRRNGAYVCGGYAKHGKNFCTSHILEEKLLIDALTANLQKIASRKVDIEDLYGKSESYSKSHLKTVQKELRALSKSLEDHDRELKSLLQLHAANAISTSQFAELNSSLVQKQKDIKHQKALLEIELNKNSDLDADVQSFKEKVQAFLADLKNQNKEITKSFLQQLISKIEVSEEGSIKIFYNIAQ